MAEEHPASELRLGPVRCARYAGPVESKTVFHLSFPRSVTVEELYLVDARPSQIFDRGGPPVHPASHERGHTGSFLRGARKARKKCQVHLVDSGLMASDLRDRRQLR